MKKYLLIIFTVLVSFSSFALKTDAALDSAITAYKKGDFEKSIIVYETLLSEGMESSTLYYNLGNSYFRIKKIPLAILNYERAKLLAPEDEDINFNLALASGFIVDKVNAVPDFFLYTWIKSIVNTFNVNQWSVIGLSLFVLTLLLMLAFLFSGKVALRKLFFWVGIIFFLLSVVSTTFAITSRSDIINNHFAIVLEAVSTAKSSPNETSTDLFIIHEGTKVTISEELDDWSEIKLADGSVGWIKSKDIENI